MTDKEIIQKLIDRDNRVTQEFFFKNCKPLFQSIIRNMFDYQVDYNEFVNELYQHLMDNDAHRLRTFKYGSSLYGWLKTVAIRYFLDKKNHDGLIDPNRKEHPAKKEDNDTTFEITTETSMDVKRLLAAMTSKRYAYVIEKLILEDIPPEDLAAEMNIKIANLYNLKKRAITRFTQVALKDIKKYKKQR